MECGVEFNADTLEIFSIALNGNLEKVAEDEPIEDWVLENFSQHFNLSITLIQEKEIPCPYP